LHALLAPHFGLRKLAVRADLAIALHKLALQLAYRGQREDALTTSRKPGASRYATR